MTDKPETIGQDPQFLYFAESPVARINHEPNPRIASLWPPIVCSARFLKRAPSGRATLRDHVEAPDLSRGSAPLQAAAKNATPQCVERARIQRVARDAAITLWSYALVVPRRRIYCQHSATRVPSTTSRSRFKLISEIETVPSWQDEHACFMCRIGHAERPSNRLS